MPYSDPEDKKRSNRESYQRRKGRNAVIQPTEKPAEKFVHARIPITWIGRISQIATEGLLTGRYPWKSNSEVTRALIGFGFEHLAAGGDEEMQLLRPMMELDAQISAVDRARTQALSSAAKLKTNLKAMVAINANDAALQYYHTAMNLIRAMPPTLWSKWLLEEIEKTFPDFAKREKTGKIPSVSLSSAMATAGGNERRNGDRRKKR